MFLLIEYGLGVKEELGVFKKLEDVQKFIREREKEREGEAEHHSFVVLGPIELAFEKL